MAPRAHPTTPTGPRAQPQLLGRACRGPGRPPQARPKVEDVPLSTARPGELDLDKANAWIGQLLQQKGADIFRMKGILAMAGAPQKFLFQGVHMIFTGEFDSAWAEGEERVSKLVFIGKNLDHEELKSDFAACLYSEERAQQRVDSLRFQVINMDGEREKRRKRPLLRVETLENMPACLPLPYVVLLS